EPVDRVRIAAHAKLNLLLRILAREAPAGGAATGYHQIETAFALLELADELVVTRTTSGITLTVHGPDLGPPEANLAVRAARASRCRPSPSPPRTPTAGGTSCIRSPRPVGRWCSTPGRLPAGEASAGWAETTSRSRSSGSTPRSAPYTRSSPRRIPSGCGCAAPAARSPRYTRARHCATTRP